MSKALKQSPKLTRKVRPRLWAQEVVGRVPDLEASLAVEHVIVETLLLGRERSLEKFLARCGGVLCEVG